MRFAIISLACLLALTNGQSISLPSINDYPYVPSFVYTVLGWFCWWGNKDNVSQGINAIDV